MLYPAKPSNRLGRSFLWDVKLLEKIDTDRFLVEKGKKMFVLGKQGCCRPEYCQAACCQVFCLKDGFSAYLEGFTKKGLAGPLIPMRCKYLSEDLWCARWEQSDFPTACREFPVPGDRMYLEVMDFCSFTFHLLEKVPMTRKSAMGYG
jgi:hypothetical protein